MSEATKVCGICGMNCAGKPRIKDPSGQYYCKSCHDEARAKQRMMDEKATAPTRAADPDELIGFADDDGLSAAGGGGGGDAIDALSDLLPPPNVPKVSGDVCPGCGQPIAPGSVVCINCGHNFQSGGQAATTIAKPEKKKRAGGGMNVSMSPGLVFLLMAGIPVLLGAIGLAVNPGLIAIAFIVATVIGGVVGLWTLVAAFIDSVLQGILVWFVPFYGLFWVFGRNENPYLKAAFGACLIAIFTTMVLMFAASGADFFDQLSEMSNTPDR